MHRVRVRVSYKDRLIRFISREYSEKIKLFVVGVCFGFNSGASHQYREVTGSNPVEVLNFSGFYLRNCINCVHNCEDHSLLDSTVLKVTQRSHSRKKRMVFFSWQLIRNSNCMFVKSDCLSLLDRAGEVIRDENAATPNTLEISSNKGSPSERTLKMPRKNS